MLDSSATIVLTSMASNGVVGDACDGVDPDGNPTYRGGPCPPASIIGHKGEP